MSSPLVLLEDLPRDLPSSIEERAAAFCQTTPHRDGTYSKRNWGGPLHSICSYQGKLKPSIAHFLVSWFTQPGDRVLDPLAGVGTIPLEARRLGRIGIGSDLSPLAVSVCRAKLEPFEERDVWRTLSSLDRAITQRGNEAVPDEHSGFGLNGPLCEYFDPQTFREIWIARRFFLDRGPTCTVADDVVRSSLLHILHGNRPYALSRRSHPLTPFAPTGPSEYKSVIRRLENRLGKVVPLLQELQAESLPGVAALADFRSVDLEEQVDALITSPPFSQSFRFWSMNWMRLWFAGWDPVDFKIEPNRFLETEQRRDLSVYSDFAKAAHRKLRPGGLLIMHLGETSKVNMAEEMLPVVEPFFDVKYVGRESVLDAENHGLRDKGTTVAHWYLFASAK